MQIWMGGMLSERKTFADLLHPGQFDLVGVSHIYQKLGTKYAVTVTISTTGKFGSIAGATATVIDTITA